ncbi:hypothetical protein PUN4_330107 [Paraburkholderia unamae]|nr:hypothetical protein PUN4_330107 [Paraburkholderia unamae]
MLPPTRSAPSPCSPPTPIPAWITRGKTRMPRALPTSSREPGTVWNRRDSAASVSESIACAREAFVAALGASLPVVVQPESAAAPMAIATEVFKMKRDAVILFSVLVAVRRNAATLLAL